MESVEQPQPPSPELREAVNTLRQSFDTFLQQAGVVVTQGMRPSIHLEPRNGSGQRHLRLEPHHPLLRLGQDVFGKAVAVHSVGIQHSLGILVQYASPKSPSTLERQQHVIVTGESKTATETTLVIDPQKGTFLHADISVPALMRNIQIPSDHGHMRFLSDLRTDPVPAEVISAVAQLISTVKTPSNYYSRNIILQEV